MLRGEKVQLCPVEHKDLALLSDWENDPAYNGDYGFFGLQPVNAMEKHFSEDGFLSERLGLLLVVTLDEQIVGTVSYHQERYGPNAASTCYNIGIALAPEQRGKGYGSEAQQLLAAYLFSIYPVMRVEASTDSENLAEQRSLEKAGFTREGVLRKAQWRGGAWRDLVVYSKLRGE